MRRQRCLPCGVFFTFDVRAWGCNWSRPRTIYANPERKVSDTAAYISQMPVKFPLPVDNPPHPPMQPLGMISFGEVQIHEEIVLLTSPRLPSLRAHKGGVRKESSKRCLDCLEQVRPFDSEHDGNEMGRDVEMEASSRAVTFEHDGPGKQAKRPATRRPDFFTELFLHRSHSCHSSHLLKRFMTDMYPSSHNHSMSIVLHIPELLVHILAHASIPTTLTAERVVSIGVLGSGGQLSPRSGAFPADYLPVLEGNENWRDVVISWFSGIQPFAIPAFENAISGEIVQLGAGEQLLRRDSGVLRDLVNQFCFAQLYHPGTHRTHERGRSNSPGVSKSE